MMNSPITVSSLNFQIRYTTTLLSVENVYAGGGLPAGWDVAWSLGTNVINVSFTKTTPSTANIPAGLRELIKIQATVPNNPAIYGQTEILSFASIVVNGNASLEGTADRAIHKVVYLGDANYDGTVNAGDAGLIQSVVLNSVTGFDTYPDVDPTIIVDSSRNLAIDAQDATNAALSGFTGGRPVEVPAFTPITIAAGSASIRPSPSPASSSLCRARRFRFRSMSSTTHAACSRARSASRTTRKSSRSPADRSPAARCSPRAGRF